MNNIRQRIIQSLVLILAIFIIGAVGFYLLLDQQSFIRCFYLTVVTLTTVGYGDMSPLTNIPEGGNEYIVLSFTILLIIFGMSIFLYTISLITEYIVSGDLVRERHKRRMGKLIGELDNHFVICGAGETGTYIMTELQKTFRPFVVVEKSKKQITELQQTFKNILYITGDATREQNLLAAGVHKAQGIIFTLPDEKDNLFAVISIKQKRDDCRQDLYIAAKVTNWKKTAAKMKKAGADIVVCPHYISGRRMVSEMFNPSLTTFLDRMLNDSRATMRVEQVTISANSPLLGTNLESSGIRQKTGLVIVAMRKANKKPFIYNPNADQQLEQGDTLITIGDMQNILKLRQIAGNI